MRLRFSDRAASIPTAGPGADPKGAAAVCPFPGMKISRVPVMQHRLTHKANAAGIPGPPMIRLRSSSAREAQRPSVATGSDRHCLDIAPDERPPGKN